MLNETLRRMLARLHMSSDAAKKRQQRRQDSKKRRGAFPDNVWHKIMDELSPFDQVKLRAVNSKLKGLIDERRRRLLYLDVLRTDIAAILPPPLMSDGGFHRHPTGRIIAHAERRSMLVVVDAHWTARDASRALGAVRFFGAFAATVTLDASLAELCVAGQVTNDVAHWFAFQAMAGTSDPICAPQTPSWVPETSRLKAVQASEEDSIAAFAQWSPRTQTFPFGPLFPNAKELTIRASIPQLRRLRRFFVYRSPAKYMFDAGVISLLRVTVTGPNPRKRQSPAALKLRPFCRWANSAKLGSRFAIQFT